MYRRPNALVFCSDKIPSPSNSTSGGGLRSFQLIQILHDLGFDVNFATPENSAQKTESDLFTHVGEYNLNNQSDFVDDTDLSLIYWCNPGTVDLSLTQNKNWNTLVDFHGPSNLESIHITGENLEKSTNRVLRSLINCDKFTYVSHTQRSYWIGALTAIGIDPSQSYGPVINLASNYKRINYKANEQIKFVFAGGWHPWLMDEELLLSVSETIEKLDNSSLHILGGPHKFCEDKFQNLEKKLRSFSKTYLEGFLSHEKYIDFLSDGVCLLDIFSKSFERKIAISTRSFEAINLGVPLIHPKWSELSDDIFEYKNGWVYENESTLLQRIIALDKNPSSLIEASANSVKAKDNLFNYGRSLNEMGQCFDSLGVKHNLQKNENSHFNINKKAKPKVLWLTPSKIGAPLSQLRVESVLSSLFCTNQVSGYMVVGSDRSICCGQNLDYFDSVVLQREGSLVQEVLEEIKTNHYLLDVDDLLIAQASYRKEDHLNWKKKFYTQFLSNLECATNVSVTSKRLDILLKKYSNNLGNYNTCIVNNGLYFKNLSFDKMSNPRAILWTSSDIAALDSSRFDVVSAINDFSSKKNIPVYCFGRFPKNILEQLEQKKIFGNTDFYLHKEMLKKFSGHAVSVSPLETKTDNETLDFISGKSDLKMVEYGGHGIQGVYSNSPPYLESDLTNNFLVSNTYDEWYRCLEKAYEKPQLDSDHIKRIMEKRSIENIASLEWMPAILSSCRSKPLAKSVISKIFRKISKSKQTPLIKKVWSSSVPKVIRNKLDPILEPLFG